jgi:hypothetical protein
MREPINSADLSYEQRDIVNQLGEPGIRDAFNAVLLERGLPLRVHRFELASLEAHPVSEEPIIPVDFELIPPPGGCYCCSQEHPGERWVCYCC